MAQSSSDRQPTATFSAEAERRRRAQACEAGMIEPALAGELARFRFGEAGEVGAHAEARAVVLGAEGIEVEGEGGGGERKDESNCCA